MSDVGMLALAIALVIAGYWMYKRGRGEFVTARTAMDAVWDATRLVETYAPAADQLVALGEMPKERRLGYVIGMVMQYIDDLDYDQVRGIVEAWVAEQNERKAGKHGD